MSDSPILRVGIPKGSLAASTANLFRRAGYALNLSSRGYYPSIDDPELRCIMFRAQEISRYVEDDVVDIGITGHDWICENGSDVVEVAELVYSKATSRPARWVLAVPEESEIRTVEDFEGGIIATEVTGVVKRFFEAAGVNVKVEFSWGATEVKARLVTGIVELTETGSSLRANNLRIVAELMTSTPRLIASKTAWADPWKRQKTESLTLLLQGAIEARAKVGLKMNVEKANLDQALSLLPAEKSPTLSPLADDKFVAAEVILEEQVARTLIPELKRAGATGIISYPLNQVIP